MSGVRPPTWLLRTGWGQEPRALHRLEPDRAGFLARAALRKTFDDPRGAGGRDLAFDLADSLVPLLAERLARSGQHFRQRLAAADSEQLDLGLAARARQPPDPPRHL